MHASRDPGQLSTLLMPWWWWAGTVQSHKPSEPSSRWPCICAAEQDGPRHLPQALQPIPHTTPAGAAILLQACTLPRHSSPLVQTLSARLCIFILFFQSAHLRPQQGRLHGPCWGLHPPGPREWAAQRAHHPAPGQSWPGPLELPAPAASAWLSWARGNGCLPCTRKFLWFSGFVWGFS